jgi:hypothetical protein
VHPFEAPPPDPSGDARLTNEFPVSAALDLVDYYEVVGFADPRTSADVWYGLLNCGLQIAAAGGTDAMANYASLRGPVGINRTYAWLPEISADPAERQQQWLEAVRAGHTLGTNGPVVGLTVDGRHPGSEITLQRGPRELEFSGFLRSAVPIDHLELVMNGEVVKSFALDDRRRSADVSGSITLDKSGWLLLRAWNDGAHPLIFDLYPYATTSPVYVTVDDKPATSPADADYFLAWIERIRETAESHPDYNSDAERLAVLGNLDAAARRFMQCR